MPSRDATKDEGEPLGTDKDTEQKTQGDALAITGAGHGRGAWSPRAQQFGGSLRSTVRAHLKSSKKSGKYRRDRASTLPRAHTEAPHKQLWDLPQTGNKTVGVTRKTKE